MPKPMYVWSGSAWVSVAAEVESLATYATQSYADNTPAMRMIVPSSVAVGSGSGSVGTSGAVTFSGASSVSLNDCFTSTYDNYRIVCHITNTSTADGLSMRLRVSGADNTTSNYNYARTESNSSATANRYGAAQTSFDVNSTDDGGLAVGFVLDLEAPFIANHTVGQINVMGQNSSASYSSRVGGYVFSATTSFTGFTIFPGSGTIAGTIRVYGYKN
jgi:hypothetical protein